MRRTRRPRTLQGFAPKSPVKAAFTQICCSPSVIGSLEFEPSLLRRLIAGGEKPRHIAIAMEFPLFSMIRASLDTIEPVREKMVAGNLLKNAILPEHLTQQQPCSDPVLRI